MRNRSRAVLFLLIAGALAACAGPSRLPNDMLTPDRHLSCSAERGMGGTGISGGERGMGGTGLMAASGERGMGGTGISPGISAGVIGTVTGFGSICVSGVRIAYDESTVIGAGPAPAVPYDLAALARGMTVAAVVAEQGDQLKASRIDVLHALVGPVTSSAPLAVMGVPIETANAAGAPAASFAVGDMVVVDGLQRPDGTIDATRLARAPAQAAASVRGSVRLTGGVFHIGAVALAPVPGALQPGAWVVASGTYDAGRLTPASLSAAPEVAAPDATLVSIEGYLLPQPGGGYAVRGIPVIENLERRLPRDTIARLAAGQRIQVIGVRETSGALRPETIVVPDFTSPLRVEAPAPPASPSADAVADVAARRRAAAAAALVPTREAIQLERGVYGRAGIPRLEVPRIPSPSVADPVRTRPVPLRPSVPARPSVPDRPDTVRQRPRG